VINIIDIDQYIHNAYATAIAPTAAATSATTLFEISCLHAAPVEVVAGALLVTAAPAATKVAVCVIVAVSSTVPDTVVVTTTVRVDRPVSVAVTVYHPLPFGVPQAPHEPGPPHPPQPAGQSEQALDVQAEDQDEQTEDWKDQIDAVATEEGQAAFTQLESAEPVAQWLAQAVGSGWNAEEIQELAHSGPAHPGPQPHPPPPGAPHI